MEHASGQRFMYACGVESLVACWLLLPLLLAVRVSGYSGDRSRKLPRIGKDRIARGVGQHRQIRLG